MVPSRLAFSISIEILDLSFESAIYFFIYSTIYLSFLLA